MDFAFNIKPDEQSVEKYLSDENYRTVAEFKCSTIHLVNETHSFDVIKPPINDFKTKNYAFAAAEVPNDIDVMRNAYSTRPIMVINNFSSTQNNINQAESKIKETNRLQGTGHECHNNVQHFLHDQSFSVNGDLPLSKYRDIREHERTQLISQKEHQVCNFCNIVIHTDENPYACSHSNKAFILKSDLQRHLSTHTGEKPYSCSQCDKTFKQKRNLQSHVKIHTDENPYACSYCDKVFIFKSEFQRHFMAHTGEKPYSCSQCDKTFKQKSNLKRHVMIHTGEKPYACNQCDKTFKHKSSLQIHIMIHTGEKPYACNQCDKTFKQKGNLKRHVMIHTREKPYACCQCDKKSIQKCSLQSHIKIHTREKHYACNQ